MVMNKHHATTGTRMQQAGTARRRHNKVRCEARLPGGGHEELSLRKEAGVRQAGLHPSHRNQALSAARSMASLEAERANRSSIKVI